MATAAMRMSTCRQIWAAVLARIECKKIKPACVAPFLSLVYIHCCLCSVSQMCILLLSVLAVLGKLLFIPCSFFMFLSVCLSYTAHCLLNVQLYFFHSITCNTIHEDNLTSVLSQLLAVLIHHSVDQYDQLVKIDNITSPDEY